MVGSFFLIRPRRALGAGGLGSPATNDLFSRLVRDNVRFVLWLAMQIQRKYDLPAQLVDVFIDVLIPFVVENMSKTDRVETPEEVHLVTAHA